MTAAERAQKNRALAEALGWTALEETEEWQDDGDVGWVTWKSVRGTSPDGRTHQRIPDWFASLDAIVEVLAQHDITLRLDFGPAYAARIIPEGRANEPPMPEFYAGNGDYVAEFGEHPTIQELAGVAFAQWVEWALAQKAEGT